jgi:hypothetical protein
MGKIARAHASTQAELERRHWARQIGRDDPSRSLNPIAAEPWQEPAREAIPDVEVKLDDWGDEVEEDDDDWGNLRLTKWATDTLRLEKGGLHSGRTA